VILSLTENEMAVLADMIAERLHKRTAAPAKPYSAEEVAEALGVSMSTVHRRIKAGEIPTVPGMGRLLIPAPFIHDLLEGKSPERKAAASLA